LLKPILHPGPGRFDPAPCGFPQVMACFIEAIVKACPFQNGLVFAERLACSCNHWHVQRHNPNLFDIAMAPRMRNFGAAPASLASPTALKTCFWLLQKLVF